MATDDNSSSDAEAPQQPSRLSSYLSGNASNDSLTTDDMQLMNSFTEETVMEMLLDEIADFPALTIEAVHAVVASERYHVAGVPSAKVRAPRPRGERQAAFLLPPLQH
jgi:hypothetical protein